MARAVRKRGWIAAGVAVGALVGCHSPVPSPGAKPGALIIELAPAQRRATGSVLYLERASNPPPRRGGPQQIDIASAGAAFAPPLHVVRAGDDLRFVNRGALAHRLFIADDTGQRERSVDPGGASEPLRVTRAGEHRFYCSLHPDESFSVFASPSDHFLVPDGRETYRFEGLPPGLYHLSWWSDAGVHSVGEIEIRAGETATRAITIGAASR